MGIPNSGLRTSIASAHTRQSQSADFASLLKDKAAATRNLNRTQRSAFDREMLAAMRDSKSTAQSNPERLMMAGVVPGALGVLQPHGSDLSRAANGMSTAGEDAQLANVDLQNMLQKQQQTMQMMTNISQQMHDTAMAVIRKIGG